MSLTEKVVLKNGTGLPCVGFGTWQTPDGETAVQAVKTAIESGYRHIDGAAVYGNEKSVGEGIRAGMESTGIKREDLFVTSKVWTSARGYENTLKACEKSLEDFGLEYFDLYLIHWPANEVNCGADWDAMNLDSWKAMTELYKAGKVKAIGVSNFLPHHLKSLMETEVPPMVDQIEIHPGWMQKEAVKFCQENGIVVEAWSPIGSGAMFTNPTILAMAEKYNKTVAHICIRWCLQHGLVPLPKSVTPSRIADNTNVFDFQISAEDMAVIDAMEVCGYSGNNPDTFNEF